jgi:hypothetical protein
MKERGNYYCCTAHRWADVIDNNGKYQYVDGFVTLVVRSTSWMAPVDIIMIWPLIAIAGWAA